MHLPYYAAYWEQTDDFRKLIDKVKIRENYNQDWIKLILEV